MSSFIKFWRNKLNAFLAHGLPAGERQLLSRFQAVSAREATVMMTAALVLGSSAGILSVGLNWSVHALREFSQDLEAGWMAIAFPALGAGLAVFMIRSMMKDFSGHGVSDVIMAMTVGSERLQRRMIFSRFFGSLFTVGSGGSTGLEGPIVCVGGAVGSAFGRWLAMNERRRKLLIGYGVAGAVAGIFNAPLTGLIFSLEIIVGEWSILTILPTIISAVSATEISRILMGNKIAFYHEIAGFSFVSLVACLGLGIITGLISIAFVRSLGFWENLFSGINKNPWIRATLGGLLVGIMGWQMPEILSEGYNVTQKFLLQTPDYTLAFMLLFVVLKFLACGITLGSGGVGGVFAPSLVIGSGVGLAYGMVLGKLPIDSLAEEAAFSLAGIPQI